MNILFVCSGNTCRSPMAEAYLKAKNINGVIVRSRGLCSNGSPVSENSKMVMSEIDIDVSTHISKQITNDDLIWADKILCLSLGHKEMLSDFTKSDKLFILGNGISDPFGSCIEVYRNSRDQIISAINELIDNNFFSEIIVHKTTQEDIKSIAQLEKICFSQPWSENSISESMKAGTIFLTAFLNGKMAGYMGVNCILDEGYITNIAVFPEFRRKGVATAILNKCMEIAKEKRLSFISLEVRKSNLNAISLYEKFGFLKEGIRKNFYKSPLEDGIIMTKRFELNENT